MTPELIFLGQLTASWALIAAALALAIAVAKEMI
jgi:hypothetical protein